MGCGFITCGSIACGFKVCGSIAYRYIGCGYIVCGFRVTFGKGPVSVPLGNKVIV